MQKMRKKMYMGFLWCSLFPATVCAQRYTIGEITPRRYEVTRALDAGTDTALTVWMKPYSRVVDSLMSPVLGESRVYMTARRPESLLSNWVADVLRASSVRTGVKADIGLCNMGGLRSAMPEGEVTIGDVLAIAPFENMLCVLTLTGADLLELCGQIAGVHGEGVSGLKLEITPDGRLLKARVNGKAIRPERRYTIATLDYLAAGNDKMIALKKAVERRDTRVPVRDVLMDFIRGEQAKGHKLDAKMEGRVTVKKS
ncbi:MAG: 5'-nucleotidase C-terminal domain-containing protein [Paraprevotella sp.]|nr:5'-nucleotidase C-terminal domain-containing protein [Paraprevotella sp.]MBP3472175.1 5'-nucleotidase C-terminal domain-containing protein [Paraprevotella sp.]